MMITVKSEMSNSVENLDGKLDLRVFFFNSVCETKTVCLVNQRVSHDVKAYPHKIV